MRKFVLVGIVAATALAVAGCGGGGGAATSTAEEEAATPAEAVTEIRRIRTLLDRAVTTYAGGDRKAAADQVGDIYLERFEQVEGPLGDRDEDLMETLEKQLSTELRNAMRDGKPVPEIRQLVASIRANLDRAEQALT